MATPPTVESLLAQIQAYDQRHAADAALVQDLRAALARAPSSASEPLVSSPMRFSGLASKLRDFLLSVKTIFEMQPSRFTLDRVKILYIGTLLEENALSWFRSLREAVPESASMISLESFLADLIATFGDPNVAATAQRRLRACSQGGRPANIYAAEFNLLAGDTGFNDEALREAYRRGLSPEIKDLLIFAEPPATLLELIALSIRIDNRVAERRAERRSSASVFTRLGPIPSPTATAPPRTQPITPASVHPAPSSMTQPASTSRPMEIDSIGRRGPLPESEKARRRRANLCMYCGQPGHIAVHCPELGRNASTSISAVLFPSEIDSEVTPVEDSQLSLN